MVPEFNEYGYLPPGIHVFFVENLYATDRFFVPKGMVEVVL